MTVAISDGNAVCDTCGAHAWVWADVQGTTIALCAHHATEGWDALMLASNGVVFDGRPILQDEESR